jgi:multiple sugar transport system ATP-binding protein
MGIRPEDLEDASLVASPDPAAIIELTVVLCEDLGSEVDVHCSGELVRDLSEAQDETGTDAEMPKEVLADTVVARMNRRTMVREGDTARVHFDLTELHFFDPESGESIR